MKIYKELGMAETALSPGNLRTYNRNDILDTYRNGSLSFAGNAGNFFNQNTQSDSVTRNNVNNTPLNSRKGPKYPQYSITCIRLSTFQAWPSSIQQHPETMAEAGFYYTGKSIQVYLSNDCNDSPLVGPLLVINISYLTVMIFPLVGPLLVINISYLTVMIFSLVDPLLVINISYLTVMIFPLVGPLLVINISYRTVMISLLVQGFQSFFITGGTS
jgi:hypothetical protein